MRVLTIVGVALVGGVAALSAQHGHQLEFGGFGTYTRLDPAFHLNRPFGGGGRLGYFLSDYFGLEVDGAVASATSNVGGANPQIQQGSASLIINSGGEHNILYVLGGYTRQMLGTNLPVSTDLNQVHAALGDRIFFGRHVALRLEARAYYTPGDQLGTGKTPLNLTGSAGLSFLLGGGGGERREAPKIPKEKRDSIIAAGGTLPAEPTKPSRQIFVSRGVAWPHQWFWGGQAGILIFKTDSDGVSAEPTFGGHWLISGKRTAVYVGYEQSFFLSDRHATVVEPDGTVQKGNVAFNQLRRIMMGVLAFPVQKALQPFAGGGFAIMEVLNPVATCTGCTAADLQLTQNAAEAAGTKAFFWLMSGIDVRQGRLALYGHYILTSSARSFLLTGVTHTFQGGLRYSFGTSREDVTEQH
jgi:hypothetical protein